jgi:hypothetical protein
LLAASLPLGTIQRFSLHLYELTVEEHLLGLRERLNANNRKEV